MKIFSAGQIREWDQYTIANEPISSLDLMERAATACFNWIKANCDLTKTFTILCGNGNNGGDGLAIARMLHVKRLAVNVFILKADQLTEDHVINLNRLNALEVQAGEIATEKDFPEIAAGSIVVDALFGTGLNRPLQGLSENLVQHINTSNAEVISIDVPSGLFTDATSQGNTIVKATHTLSFQTGKLAFMFAENEDHTGNIHLLDIGLDPEFYKFATIGKELICSIYKPRKKFTHKYSYGHALLYAGSNNMMGAAILCAKVCLKSGAGLVTVHTNGNTSIIQTALPEALTATGDDFVILTKKKAAV